MICCSSAEYSNGRRWGPSMAYSAASCRNVVKPGGLGGLERARDRRSFDMGRE